VVAVAAGAAMNAVEVAVRGGDGAVTVVPVPIDQDHIPDTTLALLVADPVGQLHVRHYELALEPLQGNWVYTETDVEDWRHQPLSDPDGDDPGATSLTSEQLLTTQDWPPDGLCH
jgi:hypothetical protein